MATTPANKQGASAAASEALPVYDFEAYHDAEIAPLMTQLIAVCKKRGIPMVASFAYGRDADTTVHCSTTLLPGIDGYQPPEFRDAAQLIRSGMLSFAITQLL